MKVIDILNKIASGEELKFSIKTDDGKFNYYFENGQALSYEDGEPVDWLISEEWLNTEVTENKEIEHYHFSVFQDDRLGGREVVESLESKLNEIIDKLNNIDNNK